MRALAVESASYVHRLLQYAALLALTLAILLSQTVAAQPDRLYYSATQAQELLTAYSQQTPPVLLAPQVPAELQREIQLQTGAPVLVLVDWPTKSASNTQATHLQALAQYKQELLLDWRLGGQIQDDPQTTAALPVLHLLVSSEAVLHSIAADLRVLSLQSVAVPADETAPGTGTDADADAAQVTLQAQHLGKHAPHLQAARLALAQNTVGTTGANGQSDQHRPSLTKASSGAAATPILLTVTKTGTGQARVDSASHPQIDCDSACPKTMVSLVPGTNVTLQAEPTPGSRIESWSGIQCQQGNTSPTCTFAPQTSTRVALHIAGSSASQTAAATSLSSQQLQSAGMSMGQRQRLAPGYFHNASIKDDGSLWTWGSNSYGQLGDGGRTSQTSPVQVGTGYRAVVAGEHHTLALKTDGSLWAWGLNSDGQLGDGSTTIRTSPVQVGTGYSAIAAGYRYSIALKADGSLWAWGNNEYGQLGDGTTTGRSSPLLIDVGYTAVAAGWSHTLALKADGSLWSWGHNSLGQLGDGSEIDRASPVQIGTGYTVLAAGFAQSLALKTDGSLWAWGINVGDGSTARRASPVQIGIGYTAVASGQHHSLALKADGGLWAWGINNYGQVGDGSTATRTRPVQVDIGTTAVAAGAYHSLALKTDGSLWAWGHNVLGQLGDGSTTQRNSPVLVYPVRPTRLLTLTMPTANLGTVTSLPSGLNCTSSCSAAFYADVEIELTATPTFSAVFLGWSGACSGSGTCRVTMNGAKNVTATFVPKSQAVALNVLKAGTGAGTVTSSPVGINCGSTCTANFAAGTQVTLAAQASAGSTFVGWSGACSVTGSCTVTLDAAKSVTATFKIPSSGGPLADPAVFVKQQYTDFLRRAPENTTLNSWVSQLNGGTTTHAQVIQSLMNSSEFQGRFGPLVRLYTAYFLRTPDYGGLMHWFNAMYPDSGYGSSLAQVSDAFAGSPEFVSRYGALDNAGFVALVYQNVLGRDAEPGGFAYWLAQLNAGMSRGEMMIGFSESAENQNATTNTQRITLTYAGMLRRSPNTDEHAQWLADMNAGRADVISLINSLLQSAEYAARF